jgi:hypothetical protein
MRFPAGSLNWPLKFLLFIVLNVLDVEYCVRYAWCCGEVVLTEARTPICAGRDES